MTVKEAREIERDFNQNPNPSEEDIFLYTEAMKFLIEEEKNPYDMMRLGGWYYQWRDFDLALKYYEQAATYDLDLADEGLGYIWYYGRTGERNYEKAFYHYSRSMKRGNPVCTYKVADMYKNGYYVEKDYEKYVSIMETLAEQMKDARYVNDPIPEVYTRLARIRTEQGRTEEAVNLYLRAKNVLAQRIRYNDFFGNLSIMKWLIEDLYKLIEFDEENFDLYDLYYLLKQPAKGTFEYGGDIQHFESLMEEGACVIHFNDSWYRSVDDFFAKACIGEKKLTALDCDLYGFRLTK